MDYEQTKSLLSKFSEEFPTNVKVFSFSPAQKGLSVSCANEKKNLLEGNLPSKKRHHVTKFQKEVRLLSLKRITCRQKRDLLGSEKGLQLTKVNLPAVINHLS